MLNGLSTLVGMGHEEKHHGKVFASGVVLGFEHHPRIVI